MYSLKSLFGMRIKIVCMYVCMYVNSGCRLSVGMAYLRVFTVISIFLVNHNYYNFLKFDWCI